MATVKTRAKTKGKAKSQARASRAKTAAKPKPKAKAKAKPKRTSTSKAPKRASPASDDVTAELPVKRFKIRPEDIRQIAEGHGACIASDKITVEGEPVRFMYREAAVHEVDSGWRFLSGLESDEYMKQAANHAFYDCNTIANYDPSIVPLLGSAIGCVFEKPPGTTEFVVVTDWNPTED